MAETLANKEKTSQIAGRNFFCLSLFEYKLSEFLTFPIEKDESCMKGYADLRDAHMVNGGILVVNEPNYYVNEIDFSITNG
ncbi:MAG: hypothetical protein HKO56_08370 [Bacteroidia bacterium]|nr:hypothetical protein [Bacteroidia bacterium]NNM16658.1 hypothetical protein [Bacteroidia bacterium]